LAAVLGSSYGGDGITTFAVPDARGRTLVGAGLGTYTGATSRALGSNGGEESHTLLLAESPPTVHTVPAHGHGWNDNNHQHISPSHGHSWNDNNHSNLVPNHAHNIPQAIRWSGLASLAAGAWQYLFTLNYGSNVYCTGTNTDGQCWATGLNVVCGSVANSGDFWVNGNTTNWGVVGSVANAGAIATDSQGGGATHNNMQPFLAVNKIIKT
jgi:microcystin-dependent protein